MIETSMKRNVLNDHKVQIFRSCNPAYPLYIFSSAMVILIHPVLTGGSMVAVASDPEVGAMATSWVSPNSKSRRSLVMSSSAVKGRGRMWDRVC